MRIEYSAEDLYYLLDGGNNNNHTVPEDVVTSPKIMPVAGDDQVNARRVVEPIPPLINRIDSAMEKDNMFLQPDLSLISLCEKVGTNRTYASKAIKDAKGCNFSDYVNRYRLDYAVELMKKTPKDNIVVQNIAVQCGCGSIQTFYRYFKLFYNETPTKWIERNK